eukprot:6427468-Amphidinium_carterae.2
MPLPLPQQQSCSPMKILYPGPTQSSESAMSRVVPHTTPELQRASALQGATETVMATLQSLALSHSHFW